MSHGSTALLYVAVIATILFTFIQTRPRGKLWRKRLVQAPRLSGKPTSELAPAVTG
jgi:hypothetical protein